MNQENPNSDEINWNHARYMLEKMSELVFELVSGEGDAVKLPFFIPIESRHASQSGILKCKLAGR